MTQDFAGQVPFETFWVTCHTMTFPESIVELGISSLHIYMKSLGYPYIKWHEDGLLYTDMPDSCPEIDMPLSKGKGYYIPISHETLELLEYDGEKCEKSKDYKLDKCRHEFIEKVNMYFHWLKVVSTLL